MAEGAGVGFVQVAVAAPVRGVFTYGVPAFLESTLSPGQLVEVPFGKGTKRGVVLEIADISKPEGVSIKPIFRVVDAHPVLSPAMIRTLRWAADYYLVPIGEMMFAALPPLFHKRGCSTGEKRVLVARAADNADSEKAQEVERRAPLQASILRSLLKTGVIDVASIEGLRKGARQALHALCRKGLVEITQQTKLRQPDDVDLPLPPEVKSLTPDQKQALSEVVRTLDQGKYSAFLLHGVTGSGKTEVYLQAIGHALASGRGAILLVPEISLTPQLVARATARLGHRLAVLHSGLSEGERLDEWRRLHRGDALVAVGARSAVFAPVRSPGILVVDEEHDPSYKQSERLPYNGRDLAMVRAREEGAVVLLGTATPSVEAYFHTMSGRSRLLQLTERVQRRALPQIEIVDLKETLSQPVEREHTISPRLAERLAETLDRGEQAILFLNRRGYSSFALCKDCGQSVVCTNCSVSLVHHLKEQRLRCHYCGLSIPVPTHCGSCGGGRMELFGLGTEKCEEEVRRRFPGARVVRMDSDSITRRGVLRKMMSKFARGEADVLVGTQMVTKGHDVPGVTLVGVILADLSLHLPDFRSAERTFQLLVQVAGRAGRGDRPGRVVIQTFLPEHESIVLAREHRFEEFFQREIQRRGRLGYPPAKRLLMVRVSHPNHEKARRLARATAETIRSVGSEKIELLGPVASPRAKLCGRYRWQMLLKSPNVKNLQEVSQAVKQRLKTPRGGKILFDVDPLDML